MRILRHTTQLSRLLQYSKWSFRTTFLWLFAGLPISLSVSELAFFATCASWFRPVSETHGRVPIIASSKKGFPTLLQLLEGIFPSVCASALGAREDDRPACLWSHLFPYARSETAWVSFRTLSMCLPLIAFSHSPLSVGFSPFVTLGYCSSFHYFVPCSEVSRPHCLINMTSCWCLQSWTTWLLVVSNILLFTKSQYSLKLNRILQFWPA